jgi:FKBP-type peptidyl-prolyl cis-trans isomerase 2
MKTVQKDSVIDVDYEGRLEDGSIFDTSIEEVAKKEETYDENRAPYVPLHVTLGKSQLIPGFENGLMGMKEGQEKTVNIPSDEAYGPYRKELIIAFDKNEERDKQLEIGRIVLVNVQGNKMPGKVVEIAEKVKVDFNHPLAGKNLIFKLKLVKIY